MYEQKKAELKTYENNIGFLKYILRRNPVGLLKRDGTENAKKFERICSLSNKKCNL